MIQTHADSHELARFVPASVLAQTLQSPRPLAAPLHARFPAAVLFADISGFTRLSERLGEQGARGVEELTRILNTYFSRLIEIIHAHGGDVAKFAGDALLAVWRADDDSALVGQIRAAAQCALQARDALRGFTLDSGETLSLRLGLGAGLADAATIGGVFERWEFVIYGPALNEATRAASSGAPDQVLAGEGAWRLLRSHFEGAELAGGTARLNRATGEETPRPLPPLTPTDEIAPLLLAYIPAAIHRRLSARQSAWLGEMRPLTVLFVNLPDLQADTPVDTMQQAMRSLQEGLYRYEGSVNKLSIDEKGVTLVAALGLPPLAHEDDPTRGVRAALELRTRLDAFGWRGSIGITSGRVFCGTIGSAHRCEYTIIGDRVNLSARLMQAAHGGILCDAATHARAKNRIIFETLEPISVKGKAVPLAVFRPLVEGRAGTTVSGGPRAMIGRLAEQQRFDERLEALADASTGGIAIIEGEAGIGKSCFVGSIRESARALDLNPFIGAADAIERSTPYFAWRGVFRQLLGSESSSSSESTIGRATRLDSESARLAPLLAVVLGSVVQDNEVTAQMSQEARVTSTNDLLVHLLRQAAEQQPRLVVLEDCHWMDSASWGLARRVAQGVPALLLVLVTRPLGEVPPREYAQFVADAGTLHLTLEPLGAEDTLELICRRLGARSLSPEVAAPIRARAQGNPFYSEELALALRDSGAIVVTDGECRVAPNQDLARINLPDTVQGVITSRIDRLSPPAQLTLKVASVIGRTFSCRLLRDVFPMEGGTIDSALNLDALVRSQLTMLDAPEPDPTQIFRHVITQEVAYHLMPPTQRSALHRSVARWYEETQAETLSAHYPLLARHWSGAEDTPKALEYLQKSAEDALHTFANEEAIRFLEQALEFAARTPGHADAFRQACWHRQLGEAHYNLDDFDRSLAHFRAALKLLGHPLPEGTVRSIAASVKEFARQIAHRALPAFFDRRSAGDHGPTLEAARAYERIAQIKYLNNEKAPTIHAAFKSLNLAERVGPCPELARSYANSAVVFGLLMLHGPARAHARRARETAEKVKQSPCTAYVDFIRSVYWVTVGEWDQAESDLRNATRIAEDIGERRRLYESLSTVQYAIQRRGDFARALETSQRLTDIARRHGSPQGLEWGLGEHLYVLQITADEPGKEAELRRELDAYLDAHPELPRAAQTHGHGILAWSYWRRGERAAALRSAAMAERIIAESSQIAHYLLGSFSSLANLYAARSEETGATEAERKEFANSLARICALLAQFRMMYPIGRPAYALHLGRLHWLRGREQAAKRVWRHGITAARRFAMPYDEALLQHELARRLPIGETAQQTHATRARDLFAQVGARSVPPRPI